MLALPIFLICENLKEESYKFSLEEKEVLKDYLKIRGYKARF